MPITPTARSASSGSVPAAHWSALRADHSCVVLGRALRVDDAERYRVLGRQIGIRAIGRRVLRQLPRVNDHGAVGGSERPAAFDLYYVLSAARPQSPTL